MTDRLIRITTALAVATVAAVAAVISYRHAYELVSTHGATRTDGPAPSVHRRRPDPGGEHAHPRRQSAQPVGAATGALVTHHICGKPGTYAMCSPECDHKVPGCALIPEHPSYSPPAHTDYHCKSLTCPEMSRT
jgi:hypothetical protein